MATSTIFNGQTITQPGVYAQILSGIVNAPLNLSFGNILIIDTGSGSGFGAGAGIAGTYANGKNAIYQYNQLANMRTAIKGGIWWRQADPLFRPAGSGPQGVSTAFVVRAAATVPATMDYTFTGGGGNGGTLEIGCKDEGLVGNGLEAAGQVLAYIDVKFDSVVAADTYDLTIGAHTFPTLTIATGSATDEAEAFAALANGSGGFTAVQLQGTSADTVRVSMPAPTGLDQATDGNAIPAAGTVVGTSVVLSLIHI